MTIQFSSIISRDVQCTWQRRHDAAVQYQLVSLSSCLRAFAARGFRPAAGVARSRGSGVPAAIVLLL